MIAARGGPPPGAERRPPRPVGAALVRRLRREAASVGGAALMVAAAVVAAEIVKFQVSGAQISPVFVIPVAAAAAFLRPAAAVAAALFSTAAYDLFFTMPLYTLSVDNAADLVTLAVLFTVAGLVSTVAARARESARTAREAARRSDALHGLAAAVLEGAGEKAILASAAVSLREVSHRTAVFARVEGDAVRLVARSDAAELSSHDLEAARWVASERKHFQAGNYPHFGSSFDFWPTARDGLVVGVRLWDPDHRAFLSPHDLDVVLGYVALACARSGTARSGAARSGRFWPPPAAAR